MDRTFHSKDALDGENYGDHVEKDARRDVG